MSLRERTYSLLVVSASAKMNTALSGFLTARRFQPVRFVASVSAARRAVSEDSFDFVIVNAPLPDDVGIRFAIDTGGGRGSVAILFVRSEDCGEVREKVAEHGVFTLPKPFSTAMLNLALDCMASMRERLRVMERKSLSVEEKMEEIRIVNRAKWLLVSQLGMDEPTAHRYLEKQAMDRCMSKRRLAEEIIARGGLD